MSKLEAAQKDAKISAGALLFFEAHPELWRAHANVNVLASAIQSRELGPLDSLDSWEKAYELMGSRLAVEPRQQEEEVPREEVWPYRFCRPIRSMQDVKHYPANEYKSLWADRNRSTGELSEKAKIFR